MKRYNGYRLITVNDRHYQWRMVGPFGCRLAIVDENGKWIYGNSYLIRGLSSVNNLEDIKKTVTQKDVVKFINEHS